MTAAIRTALIAGVLIGCATTPPSTLNGGASGQGAGTSRSSGERPADPAPDSAKSTDDPQAHTAAPVPVSENQPREQVAVPASCREAESAAARADFDAAERGFKSCAAEAPDYTAAQVNLGILLERKGDVAAAEAAYRKAMQARPQDTWAWEAVARLLCRQRRCPEAEAEARRESERPERKGARLGLAWTLFFQGKAADAATEAKKVLKGDERNVRAMQLLADAYKAEGKLELARMVLENARAVDDLSAPTHNRLGQVYLALKQRSPAMESFKRAAELSPEYAEARSNYGSLLVEAQDFETAVRELEAAVAIQPDFVEARLNLGNAYRGKLDLPRAIQEYQAVLKARPAERDVLYNLAILHLDSEVPNVDGVERFRIAIDYFKKYEAAGGKDERVEQYLKDASRGMEKEERRREREKKDALKKAAQVEKANSEGAATGAGSTTSASPAAAPKGSEAPAAAKSAEQGGAAAGTNVPDKVSEPAKGKKSRSSKTRGQGGANGR